MTLLFAAVLGINRLFVADAEQGGFDGFLLSPAERSALLVAKALALLVYMVVLELVAVPAFALLLLEPPLVARRCPGLLGVLALGDLGVAVIGALVGALAVRTQRARSARAAASRCRCSCRCCCGAALAPRRCSRPAGAGALPRGGC